MEEAPGSPGPAPGPLPVTRPKLLTILCILTLINGGLTIIGGVFTGIFFDQSVAVAHQFAKMFNYPLLEEMIREGGPSFFFVNSLLYAVSVTGAVLMWKLKKNGFHVYTIAQILLILAPMYFFHLPGPSVFDILFSGTFILLYSTQLKIMT